MSEALRPVRQRRRIALLRLAGLLLIPLVLCGESVWEDWHSVFDILEIAGVFLIIGSVLGRFWAILYAGGRKNTQLLDQGPYSVCRHPLYLFSALGAAGFGLMLGSFVMTLILGLGIGAILYVTARAEERFLIQTFGDAYLNYAARVPRLIPDPRLFRSPDRIEVNVPMLRTNLSDALVFLSLIPLAELSEWLKEVGAVPTFVLY